MEVVIQPMNLFESEICVDCGKPCHMGSGRFVNRYAYYGDEVEGWRCGECSAELDRLQEEIGGFEWNPIFYTSWSDLYFYHSLEHHLKLIGVKETIDYTRNYAK